MLKKANHALLIAFLTACLALLSWIVVQQRGSDDYFPSVAQTAARIQAVSELRGVPLVAGEERTTSNPTTLALSSVKTRVRDAQNLGRRTEPSPVGRRLPDSKQAPLGSVALPDVTAVAERAFIQVVAVPVHSATRLSGVPMVLELPPGLAAPAALLEADQAKTPSLAAAQDQLAEEFAREVADAASSPGESVGISEPAWRDATKRADRRFQLFFGDQAYNRATVRSAQDALTSEDAHPTAPSR